MPAKNIQEKKTHTSPFYTSTQKPNSILLCKNHKAGKINTHNQKQLLYGAYNININTLERHKQTHPHIIQKKHCRTKIKVNKHITLKVSQN